MDNHVWYACYGSNLNYDRFICYIEGGLARGSNKKDRGCRFNQKRPGGMGIIDIPYELYFAKSSSKWSGSSVAFIGLTKDDNHKTLGKLYLITEEQFIDLFVQENGAKYSSMLERKEFTVNLQEIKNQQSKIILDRPWYGNVLYLGEHTDNIPIFTTTSSREERPYSRPNENYLYHIVTGLKKPPFSLSNHDVVQYLLKKNGIRGEYSQTDLLTFIVGCS